MDSSGPGQGVWRRRTPPPRRSVEGRTSTTNDNGRGSAGRLRVRSLAFMRWMLRYIGPRRTVIVRRRHNPPSRKFVQKPLLLLTPHNPVVRCLRKFVQQPLLTTSSSHSSQPVVRWPRGYGPKSTAVDLGEYPPRWIWANIHRGGCDGISTHDSGLLKMD